MGPFAATDGHDVPRLVDELSSHVTSIAHRTPSCAPASRTAPRRRRRYRRTVLRAQPNSFESRLAPNQVHAAAPSRQPRRVEASLPPAQPLSVQETLAPIRLLSFPSSAEGVSSQIQEGVSFSLRLTTGTVLHVGMVRQHGAYDDGHVWRRRSGLRGAPRLALADEVLARSQEMQRGRHEHQKRKDVGKAQRFAAEASCQQVADLADDGSTQRIGN